MKRGIVILALFAAIVALASVETIVVCRSFSQLQESFSSLTPVLKQHEDDITAKECLDKVNAATDLWHKKKRTFSVYIPHNSLVELNLKVARLNATVVCGDAKMAQIELEDLLQTLPEYNNRYFPTVFNIL